MKYAKHNIQKTGIHENSLVDGMCFFWFLWKMTNSAKKCVTNFIDIRRLEQNWSQSQTTFQGFFAKKNYVNL